MRFVLACDLVVLGLLVCLGLGLLLIWYIMFYCCWCDCVTVRGCWVLFVCGCCLVGYCLVDLMLGLRWLITLVF